MKRNMLRLSIACLVWSAVGSSWSHAGLPAKDIEIQSATVSVAQDDRRIVLDWPLGQGDERGRVVIDRNAAKPLIQELSIQDNPRAEFLPVLANVDPTLYLVIGERRSPAGRPPGMSEFNVFFDSPADRPHQAHRSRMESRQAHVLSQGNRASVRVDTLSVGSFRGSWQVTVHAGTRLMQLEAVIKTQEPRCAFVYDLALTSDQPPAPRFAWMDTEGRLTRDDARTEGDRPLAVRHRTIVAESPRGAAALFPPPHQYFYPRDLTDNQSTVWYGRNHRGLSTDFGFGIRQTERGGGGFVPWFNAPAGSEQRLGTFLLLTRGDGQEALNEVLKYTRNDRFERLPGYRTLTSHFHMAITMAALDRQAKGLPAITPDFVTMFKDMGVDMVHLAEFHGDGHPRDPGPRRLDELKAMFAECKRLSDDDLLIIPGEEANVHFGVSRPGQHPGHWLYLFPKPVYWTMQRSPNQPFREEDSRLGPVYHVGGPQELQSLLDREDGLAWTAHARIKASSWAPDAYRDQPYFVSDRWLGAAWKAMPADLSDHRLGRRVLDLMDDMANWGRHKYVLGEVDVFKLDHTHELYGHMNVNYVALDGLPRFDEGWKPVLDRLRAGRFFVTTGEILIPEFRVNGRQSGETTHLTDGMAEVRARLRWTFPLRFAEVISGDGSRTYRQRIDLAETRAHGEQGLTVKVLLQGRTWVRLEVWDVAGDGAFTQPVWLR